VKCNSCNLQLQAAAAAVKDATEEEAISTRFAIEASDAHDVIVKVIINSADLHHL